MDTEFQLRSQSRCSSPLLWLIAFALVLNSIAGYLFPAYPWDFVFISLIIIAAILLNLLILLNYRTEKTERSGPARPLSRVKIELATYGGLLSILILSFFLTLPE